MDFDVKPIINKKNKQINFSLPKKKFSKEAIDFILKSKTLKLRIQTKW